MRDEADRDTTGRAAVWGAANRLGVVAGTPGELMAALLAAGLAWDPEALADDPGPDTGPGGCGADLDDPRAVCAAAPLEVTAAYERSGDPHGGLRPAWLRAGQSLIRDQDPGRRALVLLTALGDGADPRLRPALRELARAEEFEVSWARVRDDTAPPWPGPVAALAVGPGGPVAADDHGLVRTLDARTGAPLGDAAPSGRRVKALAPFPDGTLLLLDERGRALRPVGRGPSARLADAVAATLERHPCTALTATGGLVVAGDRMGSLHAFGHAGVEQAAVHAGRVTALAVEPGGGAGEPPVVFSGGADGAVRAWVPGRAPARKSVVERGCPVRALHAAHGALAVAWADGLVAVHPQEAGVVREFRPGPAVRAVAVLAGERVVVGTAEAVACLRWASPGR
ncbi:hypothetical protein ABT160_03840 [Streptomyces sp. NPDC001941]|uniref:hypothetical protein n=1 Tax=Streptomyces sp. NPDC001941 TaxID=3154659 RepID=UPI0033191D73